MIINTGGSLTGDAVTGVTNSTGDFMLSGPNLTFAPHYIPDRNPVTKERELKREGAFCGGEDVTDTGSKNRDFHVSGWLLERELSSFNDLLDSNDAYDMVHPIWSGEVRISVGEVDGPKRFDPETRQLVFDYSLDLVSTGRDEERQQYEDGIISDGS